MHHSPNRPRLHDGGVGEDGRPSDEPQYSTVALVGFKDLQHKGNDAWVAIGGVAKVYLEQCEALWAAGDRDGAQATSEAAPLTDPQFAIYSGFTCAQVKIDAGQPAEAEVMLRDVVNRAKASGEGVYLANAQMALAQIGLENAGCAQVLDGLGGAVKAFAASGAKTGEADAASRHWLAWSLEAKLAAWRLARGSGDKELPTKLREELERVAREHGIGRILARIQQLSKAV